MATSCLPFVVRTLRVELHVSLEAKASIKDPTEHKKGTHCGSAAWSKSREDLDFRSTSEVQSMLASTMQRGWRNCRSGAASIQPFDEV